ncbi:hypothetical protein FNV43_RR21851 [Rhamnella rubrinervis]|uniref:Uncharacterized protein n=1 Tax=Rhamnella rubrinervis TaxID=2594499 RepID=A0A8K0DPC2_9ROSA|nr:hypothetical protein FNV43_RR21851 [Rhamnella rubrinervis]
MEIKFGKGRISSAKRSDHCRFSRARNIHEKNISRSNNLLDAIAKVKGGGVVFQSEGDHNGVVRMKILVKKQDLNQMLEAMEGGKNYKVVSAANHQTSSTPSMVSVDQRLNLLRKKHLYMKANLAKQQKNSHCCSWSPALQSIPEELAEAN